MGIKPNANNNKVILALKRCMVDTFDDSKWLELGYLTDSHTLISEHPRLLRSLSWGDNDYEGHVLTVIPKIIRDDREQLRIIEGYVDLDAWLKNADPSLHAELYDVGEVLALNVVEEIADQTNALEFSKHVTRIRNGIKNDPEQALGSAKELLESVLKAIIGLEGERSTEDIHALLRKAMHKLDFDTQQRDVPGKDTIRRTLSNLTQMVVGIAEIRNLYGTGHGRYRSKDLEIAHVRLMVNAAVAVASFLIEISNEDSQHV